MRIVLTGMPGSGKTTVAREFAEYKRIEFIDSDMYIERKYHMSINEIFNAFGEKTFREYEHIAILELLERNNLIIAAGGGLPCYNYNMNIIKENSVSVYLKTRPEILAERIMQSNELKKRPLFKDLTEDEVLDYIVQSLEKRKEFYEKADYIIDASMSLKEILSKDPFNL